MEQHLSLIIIYLVLVNILGFALMYADKRRSMRRGHRAPEALLLFVSFIGGALGTFLAMHLCHHKSLKAKFYIGIPAILFLQLLLLIVVFLKK